MKANWTEVWVQVHGSYDWENENEIRRVFGQKRKNRGNREATSHKRKNSLDGIRTEDK